MCRAAKPARILSSCVCAHALKTDFILCSFAARAARRLDKYFESVCELDIMFNLEKAHFILDEMVMNGCIVETNKANVLKPIALMEKASEEKLFAR